MKIKLSNMQHLDSMNLQHPCRAFEIRISKTDFS